MHHHTQLNIVFRVKHKITIEANSSSVGWIPKQTSGPEQGSDTTTLMLTGSVITGRGHKQHRSPLADDGLASQTSGLGL